MAPQRAHPGGNHGGGSAVTRDRVIVALFLCVMVALGFGLASLQVNLLLACQTLVGCAEVRKG